MQSGLKLTLSWKHDRPRSGVTAERLLARPPGNRSDLHPRCLQMINYYTFISDVAFQKELSICQSLIKFVRSVNVWVRPQQGQNETLKAILAVQLIHNIANCIIKLFLIVQLNADTIRRSFATEKKEMFYKDGEKKNRQNQQCSKIRSTTHTHTRVLLYL